MSARAYIGSLACIAVVSQPRHPNPFRTCRGFPIQHSTISTWSALAAALPFSPMPSQPSPHLSRSPIQHHTNSTNYALVAALPFSTDPSPPNPHLSRLSHLAQHHLHPFRSCRGSPTQHYTIATPFSTIPDPPALHLSRLSHAAQRHLHPTQTQRFALNREPVKPSACNQRQPVFCHQQKAFCHWFINRCLGAVSIGP